MQNQLNTGASTKNKFYLIIELENPSALLHCVPTQFKEDTESPETHMGQRRVQILNINYPPHKMLLCYINRICAEDRANQLWSGIPNLEYQVGEQSIEIQNINFHLSPKFPQNSQSTFLDEQRNQEKQKSFISKNYCCMCI